VNQHDQHQGLRPNRRPPHCPQGSGQCGRPRHDRPLGGLSSVRWHRTICGRGSYNSRRGQRRANRRRLAEGRELCLGPTKANVKEGEFRGRTFLHGLNNQNLHNLLFRGFLKPWELIRARKISWIDLAQADYNPRLQQAIATGTVDFDILEMGPVRG